MIVTTAGRTNEEYIKKAKAAARELHIPYVARRKQSIRSFFQEHDEVVVVGKEGIQLHHKDGREPYFFHPNLAMVRLKRLLSGKHDAFIEAASLVEGDCFLDCTLGYASDSIVASYAVGDSGRVTGIEVIPVLAYITERGLQSFTDAPQEIISAMRRVQVVNANHYDYLRNLPDKSVDVVYFDPMFEETIGESSAMQILSPFASFLTMTEETLTEAKRVARKKIVLKDHFRSPRFDQFGFRQHVRKSSKFHYGTIECQ
ncbi:MAG: class I SAM-dependent methyltransferase [Bacillus sp. (in: firmicutes)]